MKADARRKRLDFVSGGISFILQVEIVPSNIFLGKCEPAMPKMIRLMCLMLLLIISMATMPAFGQSGAPENSTSQKLILNIYLDKTGKALVTGYVQDIHDLPFLNDSQYRYENDTLQLYALTDSLTRKDGNVWNLEFTSHGYFDDYHTTFYLPSDLMLKKINSTPGLNYLLSTSNQSMVADFQGFEVLDPSVIIEYQQPLQQEANGGMQGNTLPILGIIFLLALVSAFVIFTKKRKNGSQNDSQIAPSSASLETGEAIKAGPFTESEKISSPEQIEPEQVEEPVYETDRSEEDPTLAKPSEQENTAEDMESALIDPASKGPAERDIEVTKEMAAVMETLTPRERIILQALIEAGGRTTQAELRYRTGTPKSSLSGILSSLERRKLIIKKEWGRTNVIELSESFFPRNNRM
jgi:uncharacterized membrane protein